MERCIETNGYIVTKKLGSRGLAFRGTNEVSYEVGIECGI